MNALLQLNNVTRRFDGLIAVDGVDLVAVPNSIHAVIGPNGAGKTTLFNLVSGLLPLSSGTIAYAGVDITTLAPHQRACLGLSRTFQNIRIFREMTLLENVLAGLHWKMTASVLAIVVRARRFRKEEATAVQEAKTALEFVGLDNRSNDDASSLSYGDQRRLEIARAIVSRPKLLLLDEPAAGLNPTETSQLALLVRRIREGGTTILLVEHDMGFVMELSDRVTVLNFGKRIFEGPPKEVSRSSGVIEAYLGPKAAARLRDKVRA